MIFAFVCIWEGIQIKDDTDLVVAHSTIKLNYAEGSHLAWRAGRSGCGTPLVGQIS
jgi:hypothetical protein